jgi:hypothetical protein
VFQGKSKVAGAQHIGILTGNAQDVVVHVEYGGFVAKRFLCFLSLGGFVFSCPDLCRLCGSEHRADMVADCFNGAGAVSNILPLFCCNCGREILVIECDAPAGHCCRNGGKVVEADQRVSPL